jgi:hypothetical protein
MKRPITLCAAMCLVLVLGHVPISRSTELVTCPLGKTTTSQTVDVVPVTTPLVIGCGELDRGGPFQLVAYRVKSGERRTAVCLEAQYASTTDTSALCPQKIHPRHLWVTFSQGDTGWTFAGTASRRVRRLALRYWTYGRLKRGSVDLVSVTSPGLLMSLGLKRGFAYFEGEGPNSLNRFKLIARGAASRVLDRRYVDLRSGV